MKIAEWSQLQKAINNCKVSKSQYIPRTGSAQVCFVKDFVICGSGVYYAKYAFVALSTTKSTKLPNWNWYCKIKLPSNLQTFFWDISA